jgi:hypothetical protein
MAVIWRMVNLVELQARLARLGSECNGLFAAMNITTVDLPPTKVRLLSSNSLQIHTEFSVASQVLLSGFEYTLV